MDIRRICAGAVCAGISAVTLVPAPSHAAATTPPNIVLVVADDLGYDQTSLNGGAIPTPNLEALAGDGIRATQGYVASAVCSPSRSAILTGQEPARVGADSNHLTRARGERMPTATIAHDLPAQYTSIAIGKWDLAGASPFEANHLPAAMGFDNFYGFYGGQSSYCPGNTNLREYVPATGTYANRTSTDYLTDELTARAVDYIDSHAANPFLVYLAYNAPHVPLQTPTTCAGGTQPDPDRFADMVGTMDDGIGQIRQALADNGIADNTLVVFLSDNGQQLDYFTGDTRGGKYTLFEGGIKVPFALSWPAALPAGTTYTPPISSLDLYPTILAAAGGTPSGGPGVDLVPYLAGQQPGAPHPQLSWRYVVDKPEEGHQGEVVVAQRSGNLKWIRSTTPTPVTTNYLFDLAANPSEADSQNLWPTASGPVVAAHHAWNVANPVTESFKNPRPAGDIRAGKPDGYIEAGGTWTVVDAGTGDKSYQGTSTGLAGRSMLEGSFYTDAKVSTNLHLLDPGQAGVIVRGTGAGESFTGYVAQLAIPQNGSACAGPAPQPGGGSPRLVLSKVVDGAGTQVACKDMPLALGASYTATVRAVGATLSVSLGSTQHLTWTDPSALQGGRVGLRVSGTSSTTNTRAQFGTLNTASCSGACP